MNVKRLAPSLLALAGLIALALLSSRASAQGERGMTTDLRALVEAERAFARLSGERGMKEAFITFAADDGVLFRHTVVNAKELWRNTNPAPTGLLSWRPSFADIARAGDMGYDFGPWEFRANPTDKDAAGHGHFVTVWRKQPDGAWKFEVDIGISHPAPPAAAQQTIEYPTGQAKGETKAGVDVEATRASLLDAERELSKDAASKNSTAALLTRADERVRLFRPNVFPLAGKSAARDWLKANPSHLVWHADKSGASRSGDLGYTYGTYEMKKAVSDAAPAERGHYVRIWKRQSSAKWRVVLDITNPVRPPSQ